MSDPIKRFYGDNVCLKVWLNDNEEQESFTFKCTYVKKGTDHHITTPKWFELDILELQECIRRYLDGEEGDLQRNW